VTNLPQSTLKYKNKAHFDRAALPPTRNFYEAELGRLSRPSRGWARGNCPFHKSKSGLSFSVHLDSGAFHCFGCGLKGGDVVSFVRLRDRCDFKTACQTLGVWRGDLTPADRLEIERLKLEREWQRQREAERQANDRRERLQLRDELHTSVRLYLHVDGELHEIGPEAEDHWGALSSLLDDWRLTESAYCRAAGLEDPYE